MPVSLPMRCRRVPAPFSYKNEGRTSLPGLRTLNAVPTPPWLRVQVTRAIGPLGPLASTGGAPNPLAEPEWARRATAQSRHALQEYVRMGPVELVYVVGDERPVGIVTVTKYEVPAGAVGAVAVSVDDPVTVTFVALKLPLVATPATS
jgi:hypothetical protein